MQNKDLLEALLDSWDRNNTILVNLLRAILPDALALRPADASATIGQQFAHMHYVRLVFVQENAPEFSRPLPEEEYKLDLDPDQIARQLAQSAQVVRDAVRGRLTSGTPMNQHFDHPILLLQQMIWHEGYHHGQIKLALRLAGRPLSNADAGPITWGVWMQKTPGAPPSTVPAD